MEVEKEQEPQGFGDHTRGIVSENAHEQGWGLNQDQRTKLPDGEQNSYGGKDYDYGARDFGDEPINMGENRPEDIDKAREVLTKETK